MVMRYMFGTAWLKDVFREMRKSVNRFVSILAIVALGVGFFMGVKSTCPDMKNTADLYFKDRNLMDIHLLSTSGFDEGDLNAVSAAQGVKDVMPSYSTDLLMDVSGSTYVLKVYALPTAYGGGEVMNNPVLVSGRMPEKTGECVVEANTVSKRYTFELGDTIRLEEQAGNKKRSDFLSNDTYTVVGFVNSPQYISIERGNSTIGDGSVSCYMFVPQSDFQLSVYTDVYVTMEGADKMSAYDQAYTDGVKELADRLTTLAEDQRTADYNEVVSKAQTEIDKNRTDLEESKRKGSAELADAQKQIDDSKKDLESAKKESDKKLADAWGQITQSEQQIKDSEAQLAAAKAQSDQQIAEGEQQLADGRAQYNTAKSQYDSQYAQYQDQKNQLDQAKSDLADLASGIEQLKARIAQDEQTLPPDDQQLVTEKEILVQLQQEYDTRSAQVAQSEQQLADAKTQLDAAKAQLDATDAELNAKEQQLNQAKADAAAQQNAAQAQIDAAKRDLTAAKKEYSQNKRSADTQFAKAQKEIDNAQADYNRSKADADQKILDGESKLADAEKQLREIEKPEWYIETRDDNPGYSGFRENAERIDAVASVFPLFFLLVAALVCLTTMSRMVEEQRMEIGTLKAMGYSKFIIAGKYFIYAAFAGILGSALGTSVGFWLFPKLIYRAYNDMYSLPDLTVSLYWVYVLLASLAAIVCTVGIAVLSCYKALFSPTAVLMRPRAPKSGRRVFLERIKFLWDHMSFISKITARNILRYKGRFFMTVIGIAGCEALMLAGFGLRDSISEIVPRQFGQINRYDMVTGLKNETLAADTGTVLNLFSNYPNITNTVFVRQKVMDAKNGDTKAEVRLFVPEDAEKLSEFITMRHREDGTVVPLDDSGVVITEKMANLLGVKAGDTIDLWQDGVTMRVTVSDITENYVYNYVYMSPRLYRLTFAEEAAFNSALSRLNDTGEDTEKALASELLSGDSIINVTYTANISGNLSDTMNNLNTVVFVMIVSAGCLAFVVLYNLTNINITERIREIATIKVLGFFNHEVSSYVYRENIVLTVMGILVGVFLGIPLHAFIITKSEVDLVMFGRALSLWSYLLSVALTLLFSLSVNFVMYFKLQKVSMVESLKSVE